MTLQQSRPSTRGRLPADLFHAVPRALFLPDLIWAWDMDTGTSHSIDRREHPDAWRAAAESNMPIVTQWDDGQHHGTQPGNVATSSASMPSVVDGMLADLDARPGMTVLEIGTGTGWNAALLAHQLGDHAVTSIEVDPTIAAAANRALHQAGYRPTVITGDGTRGHADRAPYDRIIVTAGLRRLPAALIEQTRNGGIILAPWGTPFGDQDALVQLTVHGDGTASGPFLRPVEFMKVRSQRDGRPQPHIDFTSATTSTTRGLPLDPWQPFLFAAGLRLSDMTHATDRRGTDTAVWLYSLTDHSWAATVRSDTGDESPVYQNGHRRLWDELETAHTWWQEQGSPGIERFGLAIDDTGQQVWLDEPGNTVQNEQANQP